MQNTILAEGVTMARRIDLPCALVGLEPPPCRVHLKFLRVGSGWTVLARTIPGRAPAVGHWLEAHHPDVVALAPGLAPQVLRAEFHVPPPYWANWLNLIRVHHLDVTPDGMTSMFVSGTVLELETLLNWARQVDQSVFCRRTGAIPGLTPRQADALNAAVALGYYEIPHRLDLRALAKNLGISVGSVSALLRRAEAAVILAYADTSAEARWDRAEPSFVDDTPLARSTAARAPFVPGPVVVEGIDEDVAFSRVHQGKWLQTVLALA
ncbi:MAG: helix-turn-helix domain-containing protein [Thermoplasmatota archaeon]